MILKRFNESIEDYNLGILNDIFNSLDESYDVKIWSDKFTIDYLRKTSGLARKGPYPHHADLIQSTLSEKEDYTLTARYVNAFIDETESKRLGKNNWIDYASDENANRLINKYINSTFYRVHIHPNYNTNDRESETRNLLKEMKNLIPTAKSYDLVLVFGYHMDWITPFGKTTLIFN